MNKCLRTDFYQYDIYFLKVLLMTQNHFKEAKILREKITPLVKLNEEDIR